MLPVDREMLEHFAMRVREFAPAANVWAFGSRARGTADVESDLDLCVVLPAITPELRRVIAEIAWEIGFAHGRVLPTIILSQEDFDNGPMSASTLVSAIRREGIAA